MHAVMMILIIQNVKKNMHFMPPTSSVSVSLVCLACTGHGCPLTLCSDVLYYDMIHTNKGIVVTCKVCEKKKKTNHMI